MPSAGDFLRRNVRAATAARIDAWLDAELSRLAVDDPDGWDDRFARGSPCRFRLGADVLGPDPARGVIAPSCDAVGRTFVLVAFADAPIATREVETCIVRALAEVASADVLLAWLDAVADPVCDETPTPGTGFWTSDEDDDAWRRVDGLPRGENFDRLFAWPNLAPRADLPHVDGACA